MEINKIIGKELINIQVHNVYIFLLQVFRNELSHEILIFLLLKS